MVCHWVYLCLAPSCSILPERRPCVDHHCIPPHWGRADSSAQADSSVLTFEKPNSTQQWNLRPAGGGKAAVWWRNKKIYRGGGNMWKKEEKQKGEKKKWRKFYMEHYKEREMRFKAATSFNSFFFPLRSGWSSWEWFQPSFGSNQLSGKICFQYEVPAFTGNGSSLHWATARLCVVPSPAAPEPKGKFQKWLLKTGPVRRGRWVMEN